MAEPTEADRDAAYRALWPLTRYRWPTEAEMTAEQRSQHQRVAQAIADERERARAPFLALAEQFDSPAHSYSGTRVAARIRRAAEETGQ